MDASSYTKLVDHENVNRAGDGEVHARSVEGALAALTLKAEAEEEKHPEKCVHIHDMHWSYVVHSCHAHMLPMPPARALWYGLGMARWLSTCVRARDAEQRCQTSIVCVCCLQAHEGSMEGV